MTTESMVSAGHYNALKLDRDQLAARVAELECHIKGSLDVRWPVVPTKPLLNRKPRQSLLLHDAEVLEAASKEWLHDGNASAIYSGKNVNCILSARARELRNEAEGKV
jgi:hypothetical protein